MEVNVRRRPGPASSLFLSFVFKPQGLNIQSHTDQLQRRITRRSTSLSCSLELRPAITVLDPAYLLAECRDMSPELRPQGPQYNTRMTVNKAVTFITVLWFYSFVKFLVTLSLNIRLPLCGNVLDSLYCHNFLVVKLACSDTTVNNIYGLFGVVLTVLVPLLPILFSYTKILKVCFSGSKQTRQKAVSTCTPHLVSLLNFSFGCCFEILRSRFDMSSVSTELQIILSLYFLIIQPLLSPIMFGMQMSKIRQTYKRLFCSKVTTVSAHENQ
ncbi:unnamed protein product [Pleuronectes platessa]|uniref:G-protein coupled receptors family 1 profile domain-containing protein n=1 Tax=Pleuronectes platessa TaxID=8262 RepID=A0A9N7YVQ9_PLEPL|nr:unnamed protein product [Pleuronectes platessa]